MAAGPGPDFLARQVRMGGNVLTSLEQIKLFARVFGVLAPSWAGRRVDHVM